MRLRRLEHLVDAVGRTPLVRLRSLEAACDGEVEIYLKLEFRNPGGSVKDRPALQILRDALARGDLGGSRRLLDATSGNTGVAYSLYGASLGVPVTLVMPANVTQARKDIAAAFGTELVFSDPMEGSDGAIRLAREMADREPERFYYADQYANPSNPKAHFLGTGAEILAQVGDRLTHFVAGLGTSGTLMGTTMRLKAQDPSIRCIAVEPSEALHALEGLKHMASSIVPPIYDPELPDEVLSVGTEAGWEMADRLAAEEGLHVGHSTGANVHGALSVARRLRRGCVVTVAADRGDRYFAPLRWERHYEW